MIEKLNIFFSAYSLTLFSLPPWLTSVRTGEHFSSAQVISGMNSELPLDEGRESDPVKSDSDQLLELLQLDRGEVRRLKDFSRTMSLTLTSPPFFLFSSSVPLFFQKLPVGFFFRKFLERDLLLMELGEHDRRRKSSLISEESFKRAFLDRVRIICRPPADPPRSSTSRRCRIEVNRSNP